MSNVLSVHFIGILSIVLSLVQPLSDGSATIDNEPSRGDLTVTIVGSDGAALSGACFAVSDSNGGSTGGCVGGGGSGTVYGLPAGSVSVRQTSGPSGYELAGSRSGNVPENGTGSVTLTAAAIPVVVPEEPVVVPEEPEKTEDTKTDINNDTKTDTKTEIQVVPEDTGTNTDTTTDTKSIQKPTPTPDASVGRLTTELTSLASSDFGTLDAGDIAVSCRYTPGSTTADFTVQVTDKAGSAADFSYTLTAFDLQGSQAHQETITDEAEHSYTETWRRITVAVTFSDGTTGSATAGCNAYPLETGISTLAETTDGTAVHDGDRVELNTPIRDTATLTNQSVDAAGSVTYYLYESGSACEPGTHVFTSGPHAVVNGEVEDSNSYIPTGPGSYDWVAVYSGDLAQANAQTNSHFNSPATSACGDETVIVGQVSPTVVTEMQTGSGDSIPQLGSVTFGTDVRDTAVLEGATGDATGTVTYTLYEGTCPGTPVEGASFTVNVANGSVPPSQTVSNLPMGTYHWVVTYSGDEKNAGDTSECGEETFSVGKSQPTVTTAMFEVDDTPISDGGSVPVGTVSYDTAIIAGGSAPYTGKVTYTLHYSANGSDTCNAGNVEYSSGELDIADGVIPPSGDVTLDKVGVWNWVVTYSGDAGNQPATSTCGTETVNVDPVTPSITTEIHNTDGDGVVQVGSALPANSSVYDTATLTGATANAGGKVTYYLYYNDYTCTGDAIQFGPYTVSNGVVPPSGDTGPLANGSYNWVAVYTGDASNVGTSTDCGDEEFIVGAGEGGGQGVVTTLVMSADGNTEYPDESDVIVDSILHDTATLHGVTGNATGDVNFYLYEGVNCEGTAIPVGSATVVNGQVTGTSDDYAFNVQGTYNWVAEYTGDADNAAVSSECGKETIEIVGRPSSVTTTMYTSDNAVIGDNTKVLAGSTVYDTAVVSPAEATGTLTYTLYSDANCENLVQSYTDIPVGSPSGSITLNDPSVYNWMVEYSGDDDYAPSVSDCGEETFFLALQPNITTMMVDENRVEIVNGSELTAGDQIGDTATLDGATDNAGGTVTYNFYLGDSCSGDLVYAPTVDVTNGVAEDSPVVTPPFLGPWSIQAVYSGDDLNYPDTSECGTENFSLALDSTPSVSTTMKADGTVIPHTGHIEYLPADVTDTFNIFGVLPGSTGDITFELYKGTSCSGTPVFTDTQEDVVAENGSLSFESDAHTLTTDDWGTYNWKVTWSGDINDDQTSETLISECTEETFVGVTQYPYTAGITCTYHSEDETTSYRVDANKRTSLDPDIDPNLSVLVTPTDNLLNPLSQIEYHAYDSNDAPNPPVNFSHQDWRQISVLITWPSGQTWTGSASCNENPLEPELTTVMLLDGAADDPIEDGDSISLGDTVYDTAIFTEGTVTVTRTGTLTYTLYRSANCAEGTIVFGPEAHTLSGSEVPQSGFYTPDQPGTYNWVVTYSGDSNNESAISECREETFTVEAPDIAVTKAAADDEVNAGENASFTITVDNIGAGRADNVTLDDTLPSGVAWTIDPVVDGCDIADDGVTLHCDFGSIEPDDDPIIITVTGDTDAADCGTLDNPAATGAASNEPDANTGNNTGSDSIDVICADVTVVKAPTTEAGAVISAGDTASFTITVSNIGPIDATSVKVSDDLPVGVDWELASAVTGCAITGTASQKLDCTFASLAAGSSQDIVISGATGAADCGTITNEMVTVSASNEGPEATENNTSDPASITVECPDVEVSKSTTTPVISAGDLASFTVTVQNTGEGRADNVTVSDELPDGVAWAIDPAVEGCAITGTAPQKLDCTFASLAAGGSQDITVTGQTDPADCGTITNESAQVSAGNEREDENGNNTSGSASITVNCPDIEVLKTPTTEEGAVISAGDIASFTITINNIGAGRADDIEFTDVLPDGVSWSISSAVAGCSIDTTDNRTLNCSVDSLAAGGSIVITVVGTTDARDCGTLDNESASATASNERDETLANNEASSSITVQCPDVTIEKSPTTEEDAVISAGDTASFTFTVTNIGNGRADNVTVLDILPTNVAWEIDQAPTGCQITTATPQRVTCSLDELAAGASFSVTVTGVTDAEDCGELPNLAIVGATNEALLQRGNNGDSASINVLCPEMSITKVPANDTVSSGDDVSYTITAINNGEGNAYNVEVTDELPAGVTWVMDPVVSGCGITVENGIQTLSCDFGTMVTGAQQVITLTGTTAPGFCGDLQNTAYVTSTNEPTSEEVQENNSGVAEIGVDCPDIEVTKAPTTEAGAVISAGDTASFTITVDNIGAGRADNVTLNDELPAGVVWSIVPEVEGCSIVDDGATLSCTFGAMEPNDPAISITVIGDTGAENCGPLYNPAATGGATNEPQDEGVLANNSDDASIQVDCADINVTKDTTTPTISAGDTASFTITVDNVGVGRADNVTVNDTLPAGVEWSIVPEVDGCAITVTNGIQTLECAFEESLAPNDAPFSVTVTGTTDAADCGPLVNPSATGGASNEPQDEDTLENNTSGSATIDVDCPDIKVTKDTTTPTVSAGDAVSFTITVDNIGEGRADNVTVSDTLPSGVVWSIVPAVEGCSITDGITLSCTFSSIEPDDAPINIVVTGVTDAADCGSLLNPFASATVGNEGEGTLENNTSGSASIEVDCPDIKVTKDTTTPTISAGDTASFTITVDNVGEGRADNVTVTDTLPAGVAWTITPAVTGCEITVVGDTRTLECSFASMAPEDAPISIVVTGVTDPTDCGTLSNPFASATVGNEGEGTLENNTSESASIEVDCPDFKVEKTTTTSVVSAGDAVSFTITVSNIGEGRADNVTLTDTLPAGVAWTITPQVEGCAIAADGVTLSCSLGSLAPDDAPISITVTGMTDALDCGTLLNPSATGGASNEPKDEETLANNSDEASIEVDCPDIEVKKSTDTPVVSAGDAVSFTITVDNVGKGRADHVTLNDTLPTGVAWTITPPVEGCEIADDGVGLNCTLGSLAPDDAPISITVTGMTDATNCGTLDNPSASSSASNERQDEDTLANNEGSASIEVDCPDIKVTKDTTTPTVSAGDGVNFTITVENVGDGRADGVTLTDTLPAGVDWAINPAADTDVANCAILGTASQVLSCDIGTMASGASFSVTVTATTDAASCGTLDNPSASASASNERQDENTLANNSDEASIEVDCPDIKVEKSTDTPVVSAADAVSFTITVSNIGEGRADNVTLTDTLPAEVTWAIEPTVEGCVIADVDGTQELTCDIGSMAAGGEPFSVTVTGTTDAEDCGVLINPSASASANNESVSDEDEVLANNTDDAEIQVLCPEMSVTKVPTDNTVSSGDRVSYTITAINNGDGNAYNVEVTDALPAGIAWSMNPVVEGCAIVTEGGAQTLDCDFGPMASGARQVITVTGLTEPGVCGELHNRAYVTSTNESTSDEVQQNNSGLAEIDVDCPDIEVTKAPATEAGAVISAGDTASFTITVDNIGEGRADDVRLTDTLPAGVTWTIDPAVEGCEIGDDGVLTCNIGTMAPDGEPFSVTVTGATDAADCGSLDNTASALGSNESRDTRENNSDEASITVDCPDIEVTKTTDTPVVSAGDAVSFTIAVDNIGDGRADDVTLNDTLPAGVAWTITPPVAGCAIADDGVTLSCDFGSIAPDDAPISITVTGTTDAADCGVLNNPSASASASNEGDDTLGNNEASASIEVDCPDIVLGKTTTTPTISAGDTASFTITVSNIGDGRADDVKLNDVLPSGVDWAITPPVEGCAIAEDGVTLSCDFGSLASNGEPFIVTVTGATDAADCGSLDNLSATGSASNEGEDTLANNEASASIEVDCPDIEVEKTTTTPVVSAGDDVSFTITVSNTGEGRADGVTLSDTLPAGVAWTIDPAVEGCEIGEDGVLTCAIGTMASNGTPFSVTVTGTTDAVDCGTLDNPSASASASNEGDDTLGNNEGSASIEVDCPDIEVEKTTTTPVVSAGDAVSFTITVDNVGDGRADGVILTDTLPAGVAWTIDPDVEGCAIADDGVTLTCEFGSMAPDDAPISIIVTGTTDAADCGTLDNPSASASASNEGEDTLENNEASASIDVDCPDIEVEKSTTTPVVSAGDGVSYTVTVTNVGEGRADGVILTDTLPAGVTWTIDPAVEGCEIGDDGVLTCTIGTMAPDGEPFSVTVTGLTAAENCGILANTASATAGNESVDEEDEILANNADTTESQVLCPEMSVTKTAGEATVSSGDEVSYTITAINNGEGNAYNVEVTDSLPAGVVWSIAPAVESCAITDVDGRQELACDFGTMASGAEHLVTVTGTTEPGFCGELQNRAVVTSTNESTSEEVQQNNSGLAEIDVDCPDIEVEKTTETPVVSAGDAVSFTITVDNAGEGRADGVTLTDELPSAVAWTIDPAVEGCEISDDGVLTCTIGTMAPDGEPFSVTVTGSTDAADCGTLANVADASATNETETLLGNNSDEASIEVDCPDIGVEKTTETPVVSAGDDVSFTVTATNIGDGTANDVELTDALPSGIAWTIDPAVEGCEISDEGVLTCAIGTMAPEDAFSVMITGTAETANCGTLDNTASASASNEGDDAQDNNSDTASIAVNCPDIEVEKTTTTPTVSAGDDVSFTVTATNIGDGTANEVELTDELPSGIDWTINPAIEGCEISDEGVLTCAVGTMETGDSIAVTVVGETTPADCGTLANTASATSSNEPAAAALANNEASASIVVNCPDIEVEKTADAASVSASDRVSFTITATNIGEGRADEVVLTDTLPAGFNWTVTGDVAATCEVVDGNLVCSIGTLEAGASTALVVSAPATMSQCGTVQNAVSVEAGNEPGGVLDNNVAEAEAEITCPPAPTPTPGLDPDTREPVTMLPVTGSGDQAGTSSMAAFWALVIAAMLALAGVATLGASRPRKRSQ